MDNRSSKVSPSLLGLRSRAVYEDSHNSVAFPSKLSLMSVVPRFSSTGAAPENGFATPRSRGRSAIHSMARTPYSRVQTHSTFKVSFIKNFVSFGVNVIWDSGSYSCPLYFRVSGLQLILTVHHPHQLGLYGSKANPLDPNKGYNTVFEMNLHIDSSPRNSSH